MGVGDLASIDSPAFKSESAVVAMLMRTYQDIANRK